MRTEDVGMRFNHGKLSRVLMHSRARRYSGRKNTHKMHVLLEETMDSVASLWNVGSASSITRLVKLLLTTPVPKTTAEMLVSGGHVLRIPDGRAFQPHEHKLLLRALDDTFRVGMDGHSHVIGRQGLCYTISRDYFGYARSSYIVAIVCVC